MGMIRRSIITAFSAGLLAAAVALPATAFAAQEFDDVEADGWYYKRVCECTDKGYMHGYAGSDLFGVGDTLTRAQFAGIIANYAGVSEDTLSATKDTTGIPDLAKGGEWYTGACNWAVRTGVIVGYSDSEGNTTSFGPNDPITREQMVAILYRYGGKVINNSPKFSMALDRRDVSDWAVPPMKWAMANGIISGVDIDGEHYIKPQDHTLREQAAAVIVSFSKYQHPNVYSLKYDEGLSGAYILDGDGDTLTRPVINLKSASCPEITQYYDDTEKRMATASHLGKYILYQSTAADGLHPLAVDRHGDDKLVFVGDVDEDSSWGSQQVKWTGYCESNLSSTALAGSTSAWTQVDVTEVNDVQLGENWRKDYPGEAGAALLKSKVNLVSSSGWLIGLAEAATTYEWGGTERGVWLEEKAHLSTPCVIGMKDDQGGQYAIDFEHRLEPTSKGYAEYDVSDLEPGTHIFNLAGNRYLVSLS